MPDPTTPVWQLKNLGPKSKVWLGELNIHTLADIERVGVVEIYHQCKAHGHPASANLLYALQGAILGIHWNDVPSEMRAELRRAAGIASRA
jgi:DNA transformation protein and related proteins